MVTKESKKKKCLSHYSQVSATTRRSVVPSEAKHGIRWALEELLRLLAHT